MKLENIVPWGRNLSEYVSMFLLGKDELNLKILGCGDGPSSFNMELDLEGGSVVSVDPLYSYSKKEIISRIDEVTEEIMTQVTQNSNEFVWKNITNPNMLLEMRVESMTEFLIDYSDGKEEGRYIAEELPNLSFNNKQFDLALCSHLLFLYSDKLDEKFHLDSILEMLRVSSEVRIFPIVNLQGNKSQYIDSIISNLSKLGYKAEIIKTAYEFQKGGFEMLKIKS